MTLLSAFPPLYHCNLSQPSCWDNYTTSQYDAPGMVPVTALNRPDASLCISAMIVMVSKWFAVNMTQVVVCVPARTDTWKEPAAFSFDLLTVDRTLRLCHTHQSRKEGFHDESLKAAASLHCAAGTLAGDTSFAYPQFRLKKGTNWMFML